jgi:hypothetical protein
MPRRAHAPMLSREMTIRSRLAKVRRCFGPRLRANRSAPSASCRARWEKP